MSESLTETYGRVRARKLVTLQTAAVENRLDKRTLAQAMLAAGEQPVAILEQPSGEKPLYFSERVKQLAQSLKDSTAKHSKS